MQASSVWKPISHLGSNRIFTTYWLFFPSVYDVSDFWGATSIFFFRMYRKGTSSIDWNLAYRVTGEELNSRFRLPRLICLQKFLGVLLYSWDTWGEKGARTQILSNPDACLNFHRYLFPEGPSCPSPEAQVSLVQTKMKSLSSTGTQIQCKKH